MFTPHSQNYSIDGQFKPFLVPSERERKIFCLGCTKYTPAKLSMKIKQLEISCGFYFDPVTRSTNVHEKESIRILKAILKNTDRKVLQMAPPSSIDILIQSSLVLVQAYVAHLKIRLGFWDKFKRKPFAKSVKYFHLVIFKFIPEMTDKIVDETMKFLKDQHLWSVEFICCEILTSLLACRTPTATLLSKMLDYLEEELKADNMKEARNIIRVLHKILHEQLWIEQKAIDCSRLLQLFYESIKETDVSKPYHQMRRGFERCLVRMCEIIENPELMNIISVMFELCFGTNLPPEAVTVFSHALEIAILFADVETITKTVEPKVLIYVLEAITSANPPKSRLASRLLARLFDRHRNFAEFITPRLFMPNKYYTINLATYHPEDKEFFKRYRAMIEYHLLLALRQHQTAPNLETIFTVLCTMVIESPCGYTACQVISILLELQDYALALNGNISTTETNQMHAIVISVMMLVAWQHRASSLSLYTQRILNRRADNAPHLNPPMKQTYQYAQHHVLWNEPLLFFDFWEIRYALWKRFRSNEPQIPLQSEKLMVRKLRTSKADRVQDEIITSNLVRESVDTPYY